MLQKRAGFFMSGGMRKELRGDQNHEAQAERNCGDGVQDVAQAFIGIEIIHGNLPFHDVTAIGDGRNIGMGEDFLGQVFESEV